MKQAILSRDVTVKFREYEVTAKAGTPLEFVKGASGTSGDLWAIPPRFCGTGGISSGPGSIFAHDAAHYYIWAPADAVEVL